MPEGAALPIRLLVAVFGAYLLWRSANGWLKRRKSEGESRPVDRVWPYFIFFIALAVLFTLVIILVVGVGVPLVVFDLLIVGFVVSLLGIAVCGFLVGWYSHDD